MFLLMLYSFVNLATALNKYIGLCFFSFKKAEKSADLAVFKAILYFLHMQYKKLFFVFVFLFK